MLRRVLALVLVLLVCACTRTRKSAPSPVASGTTGSMDAGTPASSDGGTSRGPHATDAEMSWAFWTRDGALVAASKADAWKLSAACAPPQRVPLAIDAMVARNGVDRFVVQRGGALELWDASTMRMVGPIDHAARDRGAAIAPDGSRIAFGGCKEIASDPKLATTCGEIYDAATGRHAAGFVGKHDFETLSFSDDGSYLMALSGDHGMSVFDTSTGKLVVTRPRWAHMEEVDGWNRPSVAAIFGHELVVVHGDTVEHVDLTNGKTLGKLASPRKTLAVFGAKSNRVAVLEGEDSRARVWDVASHKVVRTFELAKTIHAGANCRHCALEMDDIDEDKIWLTSAYTDDRLALHIGTGQVKRVDGQGLRLASHPSSSLRVEAAQDEATQSVQCTLTRRDRAPVPLPVEYCERTRGPSPRPETETERPYPGFDPSGRFLASIYRSELRLWDIARGETSCVAGKRR